MYAQYFGLRELPFNNTPDPRFFYSTPDHEEALASLIYAVQERKGFVLLTGEIGAGKTLVSRMMLRHFGTMITFATINHAIEDGRDLLESICTEFELHVDSDASRTHLVRLLHDYLLSKFAQNLPVVLVLDEAQNLSVDAFEQLRMVGNLEADDAKLLQVVIVGQPELQKLFASPQLCQLRQRVFRNYHLPALSREDTEGYIKHRLSVAGSEKLSTFTADAVDRVYEFAHGVPRVINTLCDNAMLSAYSSDAQEIDGPFVDTVISQMMVARPTSTEPDRPASAAVSAMTTELAEPVPPPVRQEPTHARHGQPDQQGAKRRSNPADTVAARPIPPNRRLRVEKRMGRARNAAPVPPPPDPATAQQEQLNQDTHKLTTRARTARGELDPLVHRAESLVARAELAVHELDRREDRLRNIDRTVTVVIRDLRMLLDRAQRIVRPRPAGPQAVQQNARQIADEAASCRRIADSLVATSLAASTNAIATERRTNGNGRDEGQLIRQAETKREDIEGFRRRADQLRERLRSTRTGLSELRSSSSTQATPPTTDNADVGAESDVETADIPE